MTPERRAIRDAWIAECWPVCRELPLGERVQKRLDDVVNRALLGGGQAVDDERRAS